jgi:GTP-binding protein Era
MKNETHSGYVAIVGRPNVGKSTLLNCILGKKISITTPKPQTTRTQILGIKSDAVNQVVYIDTPGIHDDQKKAMNRYMNRLAGAVIKDADAVIFIVAAGHWNKEDELVLSELSFTSAPVILVINMVDKLKDKAEVLPFIAKLKSKYDFADVIPLSALKADNVSALETEITKLLPAGPHLFPDDQITDKPIRFQIAEIIREKIIQATEQELPYSTSVEIEHFIEDEKLIDISAIIWVEREGQKPIVIGKDGARLKKIGTQARKDMEKLLDKKVFLRLWVKVKENWADDEKALRSLGYQ